MRFEGFSKMALVCETRRERNLAQRNFGRRDFPTSEFDAQATDIFANRAAVLFTKHAGEMNRMNIGDFGDILKIKRF